MSISFDDGGHLKKYIIALSSGVSFSTASTSVV